MIVVKITRKCGICGEEINLVLDILDLVYDEKTKRFLHAKCEKERLLSRKRGRMPPDEVDSLVEKMSVDAREAIAKCVTQKRRSIGSSNKEKTTSSDNPKRLLTDYLLYTYDLSYMPKYIYVKLASVYSGKYERLKKPCPPEDLLDMWQRKQAYLNRVYECNMQKGNCMDSIQRISYDLAILLSRYDGYLEWKEKQLLLGEQQQESAAVIYENIIPRANKPNRHKDDVSIADVLDEI